MSGIRGKPAVTGRKVRFWGLSGRASQEIWTGSPSHFRTFDTQRPNSVSGQDRHHDGTPEPATPGVFVATEPDGCPPCDPDHRGCDLIHRRPLHRLLKTLGGPGAMADSGRGLGCPHTNERMGRAVGAARREPQSGRHPRRRHRRLPAQAALALGDDGGTGSAGGSGQGCDTGQGFVGC